MLIIAETIETCAPVRAVQDWNQYAHEDSPVGLRELEQFSPEELDVMKAWFDRLAAECRDINEHVPTGGRSVRSVGVVLV